MVTFTCLRIRALPGPTHSRGLYEYPLLCIMCRDNHRGLLVPAIFSWRHYFGDHRSFLLSAAHSLTLARVPQHPPLPRWRIITVFLGDTVLGYSQPRLRVVTVVSGRKSLCTSGLGSWARVSLGRAHTFHGTYPFQQRNCERWGPF